MGSMYKTLIKLLNFRQFITHLTVERINKMIITELLAGVAKTLVVSILSERVVLRVFVMFAEWASANSSTSIDYKIVS